MPGQIVTESLVEEPTVVDGEAVADPARDLAKIAVVERHLGTGRIGLGFVRGFGLRRGALASTVAHDAHNIVVVGMNDGDMALRGRAARGDSAAGIVAVDGGERARRAAAAGRRACSPTRRSTRSSPRARACVEAARELGCTARLAVPDARVPRAVGDPAA